MKFRKTQMYRGLYMYINMQCTRNIAEQLLFVEVAEWKTEGTDGKHFYLTVFFIDFQKKLSTALIKTWHGLHWNHCEVDRTVDSRYSSIIPIIIIILLLFSEITEVGYYFLLLSIILVCCLCILWTFCLIQNKTNEWMIDGMTERHKWKWNNDRHRG